MGGKAPSYQGPSKAELDNQKEMMKMIADMKTQQAEAQKSAAEAQDRMVYQGQVSAAQQAGMASANEAAQQLAMLGQYQQAKDASALMQAQQAASGLGKATTGGTYDINAARQQQLANLGAVQPLLPQTQANLGQPTKNPASNLVGATTSALANKLKTNNQLQRTAAIGRF